MTTRKTYEDSFYKNLNKLTGIPISKIKNYAKENNPFNILEHPMVVDPSDKQLDKICKLNDFIASYNVLRMEEESNRIKFSSPMESGKYFTALIGSKRDRERFMVAFLDTGNRIIETKTISEGNVNSAIVYPRDILKMALSNDCKGLILAHNHPSGSLKASPEDVALTQRIIDIFQPLDIKVLDHIIVGGNQYISLAEEDLLERQSMNVANYDPIKLSESELDDEVEL